MNELLEYLFANGQLTKTQAKEVLGRISEGQYNSNQVSAFLTVFRMRDISLDELIGFRDCLKERSNKVDLSDFDPIDLCGTGGDGKDTFNISTLASFVTAGAGIKVAKHGNYGVSSSCGSSNVMEFLGYKFTNDHDRLKGQIEQSGICFLHAPLFHPAMKEVAPIRRSLGVRTFFNMLGPLVNPSSPQKQVVGVSSLHLQRYYKYIFEQSTAAYRIVHSLDGYDEISLTSHAMVISEEEDRRMTPSDFSSTKINGEKLYGGKTVASSAKIFIDILEGVGSPEQIAAVAANASLAIHCCNPQKSSEECVNLAIESLESGKALNAFKTLIES
ncbi:MAG: anthranilate phosphoribosyltransferase [Flavobacteriales bacterium]|nr:anthranilate phosphoribosyltransferase [Flavobacteriales bacterium]